MTTKPKKPKRNGAKKVLHEARANAAGIDVGAYEIFVAVPEERDKESVRSFSTPSNISFLYRNASFLSILYIALYTDAGSHVQVSPFFVKALEIIEESNPTVLITF